MNLANFESTYRRPQHVLSAQFPAGKRPREGKQHTFLARSQRGTASDLYFIPIPVGPHGLVSLLKISVSKVKIGKTKPLLALSSKLSGTALTRLDTVSGLFTLVLNSCPSSKDVHLLHRQAAKADRHFP